MNARVTRTAVSALLASIHATVGCAQSQPPTTTPRPAPAPGVAALADTTGGGLIPAGFGSLRQDSIAIRLQLPDVLVTLIPLDESVIRALSPDAYRSLHDLVQSKRPTIARMASQHGLVRANLWYVLFYGLAPDARFSPLELTISSAGQDFRPLEILPLTSGFGEQRLKPREYQRALYLMDDAVDVNQPLDVSLGSERNSAWATQILPVIERERALIRSRALARGTAPKP